MNNYAVMLNHRFGGAFIHPRRFNEINDAAKFAERELKRWVKYYSSAIILVDNGNWESMTDAIIITRGNKKRNNARDVNMPWGNTPK